MNKLFSLLLALCLCVACMVPAIAQEGGVYVLMNIPYAAFYAAEVDVAPTDAVSSATLMKPRAGLLVGMAADSQFRLFTERCGIFPSDVLLGLRQSPTMTASPQRTAALPQGGSGGSAGLESEGFASAGRACNSSHWRDCYQGEAAFSAHAFPLRGRWPVGPDEVFIIPQQNVAKNQKTSIFV